MSECIPITRFDQEKRRVLITDHGIEVEQNYIVEPYDAYPEVAEWLLGNPAMSHDAAGIGHPNNPPRSDPYHSQARCYSVEVFHTPSDVSSANDEALDSDIVSGIASGMRSASWQNAGGNPMLTTVSDGTSFALSAASTKPKYKIAYLRTRWRELPEWRVDLEFNARNRTLPQQLLVWETVLDANGNAARLGLQGLEGGTEAVKTESLIDLILTPARLGTTGSPITPNPPWINTVGSLQGRINQGEVTINLYSWLTAQLLHSFTFPAETLLFSGYSPTVSLTTNTRRVQANQPGGWLRTGDGITAGPCNYYPLSYDYWDHSWKFTFLATTAEQSEFIGAAPAAFTGTVPGATHAEHIVGGYFPGWNRQYWPGKAGSAFPTGGWDNALWPDGSGRKTYQYYTNSQINLLSYPDVP